MKRRIGLAGWLVVATLTGCNDGKTGDRERASAAAAVTSGASGPVTSGASGPVTTATTPPPPPAPPPATTVTLALQLGQDAGKDAHVQSGAAARQTNAGAQPELLVGDAPTSSTDLRAFIEFGLAQLPLGAQVASARLELFVVGARGADQDVTLRVHRVVPTLGAATPPAYHTPWHEGSSTSGGSLDGVCWDAGPASRHTQPQVDPALIAEQLVARGTASHWVTFDVTAAVTAWHAGAAENHGLRLSHATEGAPYLDGAKALASSDHADPTKRPRLIIDYTPSPTRGEFVTLQPGPSDGKDTYVRDEGLYNNDNFGAAPDLQVGDRSTNQLGDRRSYLQMALPASLAGRTIVRATLELYHHGTSFSDADVTLRALRVVDTSNKNGRGGAQTPWVEGTSTWDAALDGMAWDADPAGGYFPQTSSQRPDYTQPDVDESTNYGRGPTGILDEQTIARGTLMRWYALDVTEAVRAWLAGAPNHGLRLMHQAEGAPHDSGTKHLVSSDLVHLPNHRPLLRVEYR